MASDNFIYVKEINKLRSVIKSGLCNRCGSCVGLSEGKIIFVNKTKKYLPKIIIEPDEELSRRIWQACSGKDFDFNYYKEQIFSENGNFHRYIGSYQNIYIGHCLSTDVRNRAASGGILSSILIWLLENNYINGAVVLGMSDEEPWMNKPFIATSREEIIKAAQSKYTISSVNEILPEMAAFKGKLAYVGLPGQVQSIRKLQQLKDPIVQNIKYIIGPFYGNTLHFSSIISFLRSHGEKNYTQIKKLNFRHGEWPGNMHIEMQNGKVIEMPKFHANYLIPFHIMKNSLLCSDLSNEFTDISGGDAWAPVYEERGKGFSLVISRSQIGQDILDKMLKDGVIHLQSIAVDDAITMHSHGYDLKKRGTFIRMKFRRLLGLEVPNYGYQIKGFAASRFFMEFLIDIIFLLAGTKLFRYVIEQIPPRQIGFIFEKARTFWKKRTYSIKRSNL